MCGQRCFNCNSIMEFAQNIYCERCWSAGTRMSTGVNIPINAALFQAAFNRKIPAGKDEMRILADTKEIFVVADSPSDYDAYCMRIDSWNGVTEYVGATVSGHSYRVKCTPFSVDVWHGAEESTYFYPIIHAAFDMLNGNFTVHSVLNGKITEEIKSDAEYLIERYKLSSCRK